MVNVEYLYNHKSFRIDFPHLYCKWRKMLKKPDPGVHIFYSSNKIRKKQTEHLNIISQNLKGCSCEFNAIFLTFWALHSVANVYAVLPFYNVKCPFSGGQEWGREESHPPSISIFDFYGIKALWFEFGNVIFTGFKMPRL